MRHVKLLLFLVLFLPGLAFAQGTALPAHASPNNCVEPSEPHSHWRRVGVRPVAPPIQNAQDVVRIASLATWHPIALRDWPIDRIDLQRMILEVEQGNVTRVEIPPCTVLDDMIFSSPPMNYGRKVVYDPDNRQTAHAYVVAVTETVRVLFFEMCANPSYQSVTPPPPPTFDLTINKQVRGQSSITANRQETVDLTVTFQTIGTGRQTNVVFRDVMHSSLQYVQNSLRIDGASADEQRFLGSGIAYAALPPGTTRVATYQAVVNTLENLSATARTDILDNTAFVRSDQVGEINARAEVRVITTGLPPKPPPPPPPPPCPECPTVSFDFDASGWSRSPVGVFRGWNPLELAVSVFVGTTAGYFGSSNAARKTGAWQSAGFSALSYGLVNAINPDKDRVRVAVANGDTVELKSGQQAELGFTALGQRHTGRAIWENGAVRFYLRNPDGTELFCSQASVPNNLNFTPVPVIRRAQVKEVIKEVPGPCFVLVDGQVKPCLNAPANPTRPTEASLTLRPPPITPPPQPTGRPTT